ncbi:helix-turn-helix transcriptional regulator [Curtobacterium sp. S6]|uniref:helix-turn-helix transcriptional regulator n=1 Tax=Curtobacterium sp. S6 TaxID=1479623 RepID=UPI00068F2A06|nr:WYL domain-containing protein [Curtobacterium sp. S6]
MNDPTSRALKLLGLFRQTPMWEGRQLAEELGVTPRTLRRDIERLREAGYRISSESGHGGGYGLDRGQLLPSLALDQEEALALTLALDVASTSVADRSVIERAKSKVEDLLPESARRTVRGFRASLDLEVPVDAELSGNLQHCAEGARRHRRLRFRYVDRRSTQSDRWVEPYSLMWHGSSWYLGAFDVEKEQWRQFRVDRMREIDVGQWAFSPRRDAGQALNRLREPMPLAAFAHTIDVEIRCGPRDIPPEFLWGSAEVREIAPGRCRYRAGTDDPDRAASFLARLEHPFVVVGDEAVRRSVAGLAQSLGRSVAEGAPTGSESEMP